MRKISEYGWKWFDSGMQEDTINPFLIRSMKFPQCLRRLLGSDDPPGEEIDSGPPTRVVSLGAFTGVLDIVAEELQAERKELRTLIRQADGRGLTLSDIFPNGNAGEFLDNGKALDSVFESQEAILEVTGRLKAALRSALVGRSHHTPDDSGISLEAV